MKFLKPVSPDKEFSWCELEWAHCGRPHLDPAAWVWSEEAGKVVLLADLTPTADGHPAVRWCWWGRSQGLERENLGSNLVSAEHWLSGVRKITNLWYSVSTCRTIVRYEGFISLSSRRLRRVTCLFPRYKMGVHLLWASAWRWARPLAGAADRLGLWVARPRGTWNTAEERGARPWPGGSVGWNVVQDTENRGFDSLVRAHTQAAGSISVGRLQKATNCFSHSDLSLFPFLSL